MDEEIPNLVTAQASSISITSFVSKGVSLLIAQYMPSLRVKSNVCTIIICTHKSCKHYIPKSTNIFLLNSDSVFLASSPYTGGWTK